MRRKWPIIAGTVPLMLGWALTAGGPAGATAVAGGPAAAATGMTISVPGASTSRGTANVPVPDSQMRPGGPLTALARQAGADGPRALAGTAAPSAASSNWSGYAATGSDGTFTSVSASWTEPAGSCAGGDQASAFWAGLDGYASSTVEQAGSEVDCAGRTPQYYAWYEMYPDAETTLSEPVKAGDQFTASVAYLGSGIFRLELSDATERWSQTVRQTLAGADLSSAEVIAEAPCCTSRGDILPLTDFGTVSFGNAMVNKAGLCDAASQVQITMPDTAVSALSGCAGFSVSYTQPATPAPAPPPFRTGHHRGGS